MSQAEVCSRALECFLLMPGGLVTLTQLVEHGRQIAFGFERGRMIRARVPNAMLQHFALNRLGLVQFALLEQDFAERAKQIDSQRMAAAKR